MKAVDLSSEVISAAELLDMARKDPLLVKTATGDSWLPPPCEFATEAELLRRNHSIDREAFRITNCFASSELWNAIKNNFRRNGMNTLVLESECLAREVKFTRVALVVALTDGRRLTVPLAWYPRLLQGTQAEREHYELIGEGEGIHWPDLDEDISVEGLLAGRRSQERDESLQKWMKTRAQRRTARRRPTRTRAGCR